MTETRILLIDSDKQATAAIEECFSRYRVALNVVDDPGQAIIEAGANTDLILLRIELPTVSGYLVCNRLKKNRSLASIPLVIYSSEATDETFEHHKQLKTSANSYLKYPFAKGEPLAEIKKLVNLNQLPEPVVKPAPLKEATPAGLTSDVPTASGMADTTSSAALALAASSTEASPPASARGRRPSANSRTTAMTPSASNSNATDVAQTDAETNRADTRTDRERRKNKEEGKWGGPATTGASDSATSESARERGRGRSQTRATTSAQTQAQAPTATHDSFSLNSIQETELDMDNLLVEDQDTLDFTSSRIDLQSDDLTTGDDFVFDDDLGHALDQALLASLESGGADLGDDLDIEAIMSELEALGSEFDEGAAGEVGAPRSSSSAAASAARGSSRGTAASSADSGADFNSAGSKGRGRGQDRDRGRDRGGRERDQERASLPLVDNSSGASSSQVIRDGQRILEAELAGARARAQALDATVHNLKQRMESARKEAERELISCRDQISVLKDQLSAKMKLAEELQGKLDKHQHTSLEDAARLQTRLEVANRDLTAVRRQLAQANEANAKLEQYKAALATTIENTRQKFRAELEKARRENAAELERLAREHRNQMTSLVESHTETSKLDREKLDEEIARRTRAAIEEHEARYAAENADLRRIQQERELLVRDLRRAHDRTKAKWEGEKKALITELEETHDKLANVEAVAVELKGRFSDLRGSQAAENESLRQEVGLAKERIYSLEQKLVQAGDQIGELSRQLEAYRDRSVQTLEKARASEKARQKAIRAVRIAMSLLDETAVAGGGAASVGSSSNRDGATMATTTAAVHDQRRGARDWAEGHGDDDSVTLPERTPRFGSDNRTGYLRNSNSTSPSTDTDSDLGTDTSIRTSSSFGSRDMSDMRDGEGGSSGDVDDRYIRRMDGHRGMREVLGSLPSLDAPDDYGMDRIIPDQRRRTIAASSRRLSADNTISARGTTRMDDGADHLAGATNRDDRRSYLNTRAALLAALEEDDEF